MTEGQVQEPVSVAVEEPSIRDIVREAVLEVFRERQEPQINDELAEERKRRETLEQRLNDLVEENHRNRAQMEEAERQAAIRGELQRMGVAKVELAFRAVKDEVHRAEDGRIIARNGGGEVSLGEYLKQFLEENPELLPSRIPGGSGMYPGHRESTIGSRVDLDKIRPGMSPEELERARQEIVRIASQTFRGL